MQFAIIVSDTSCMKVPGESSESFHSYLLNVLLRQVVFKFDKQIQNVWVPYKKYFSSTTAFHPLILCL